MEVAHLLALVDHLSVEEAVMSGYKYHHHVGIRAPPDVTLEGEGGECFAHDLTLEPFRAGCFHS